MFGLSETSQTQPICGMHIGRSRYGRFRTSDRRCPSQQIPTHNETNPRFLIHSAHCTIQCPPLHRNVQLRRRRLGRDRCGRFTGVVGVWMRRKVRSLPFPQLTTTRSWQSASPSIGHCMTRVARAPLQRLARGTAASA